MNDPTLIADLIRAGVDPDLVGRVANALVSISMSAECPQTKVDIAAERRREKDRERKRAVRGMSADSADCPRNSENAIYISSTSSLSTNTEFKEEEEKKDRAKRVRVRGHPLPHDFAPNDNHRREAAEMGRDARWVDEQFRDMVLWARANEHRAVARKSNWDLTLSAWMRRANAANSARASPSSNSYSPRPGSREDRMERTHNALAKLRKFANGGANDASAGGRAGDPSAGLLPFAKPA